MPVPKIEFKKLWLEKKKEILEATDIREALPKIQEQMASELYSQLFALGFTPNNAQKASNIFREIIYQLIVKLLEEMG